jgi:hypothetical protein
MQTTKTGKTKTCANTPLLAGIKRAMNHKVYKQALVTYNHGGETECLAYVQQFFNVPVSVEFFTNGPF